MLEIVADPVARTVDIYAATGSHIQIDATTETITPAAFPDLHVPIAAIFATLDISED